jgi:hypothetical protein
MVFSHFTDSSVQRDYFVFDRKGNRRRGCRSGGGEGGGVPQICHILATDLSQRMISTLHVPFPI